MKGPRLATWSTRRPKPGRGGLGFGVGVWGFGFGLWGSGSRVRGLVFRVWGVCRVESLGLGRRAQVVAIRNHDENSLVVCC